VQRLEDEVAEGRGSLLEATQQTNCLEPILQGINQKLAGTVIDPEDEEPLKVSPIAIQAYTVLLIETRLSTRGPLAF
jgi:hypothetical protein